MIKGLVTSLSQSQRMVMMARIKVWIAVPPKIIPAQIPYECPISFADVTIEKNVQIQTKHRITKFRFSTPEVSKFTFRFTPKSNYES